MLGGATRQERRFRLIVPILLRIRLTPNTPTMTCRADIG
jgi:hypothetical protein